MPPPPHPRPSPAASKPPDLQGQGNLQNCLCSSVPAAQGSRRVPLLLRGEIRNPGQPLLGAPPLVGPECGLADQPRGRLKFCSELCGWSWLLLREGTVADGIRYYSNFTDKALRVSQKKFKINSSASQQKSLMDSEAQS